MPDASTFPVEIRAPVEILDSSDLDFLTRHVVRNRFIPEPPPELRFVGDGDFRAIGAEFLGLFARLGGLRPGDAVIDIGCGIGRMALPLTQYLDPASARYDG